MCASLFFDKPSSPMFNGNQQEPDLQILACLGNMVKTCKNHRSHWQMICLFQTGIRHFLGIYLMQVTSYNHVLYSYPLIALSPTIAISVVTTWVSFGVHHFF